MASSKAWTQVLGGFMYFQHPSVVGTVLDPRSSTDSKPVVLVSKQALANFRPVRQLLDEFSHNDDVYSTHFSKIAIMQTTNDEDSEDYVKHLEYSGGFSSIHRSRVISDDMLLPSGPYFLDGPNIHQAWRLYPDDLDAFIFSVIPEDLKDPSNFIALDSFGTDGIWKHVAVPSRLYATPSADKPLAGIRLSLKDIFQLAGTKRTMMSRAYTKLYGPDKDSANYVKKLLDLGAVIVGKTKMTSFASSEEPTDQWIDFHCPINPRGDTYQSPSGSSSGAAASLAGYSWLDISVAGDSAGSVRAPATCNGIFSLRSSFDSTSMDGVAVNSPEFDVVGLLSRELQTLQQIASTTLNLSDSFSKFPSKILYPTDFFPHGSPKHQEMVDEFIAVFEKFLGVKRTEFNITERWSKCPPNEAKGKSLKEYLQKSAFWSMCYDYYHQFDKFRVDYKNKFGQNPYQGAIVKFRWSVGESVTEDEYHQRLDELKVFRTWFNENVFSNFDSDTLSDAIMIMPYGSANPKYRDSPNEAPSTSHTISEKFIAPVLHMPQLVLPFGQMPYESRISGRVEYRPIASTLVGAKGSDLMLIKLAKMAFEEASWPTKILTGRLMYELGDNLRNVADGSDLKEKKLQEL